MQTPAIFERKRDNRKILWILAEVLFDKQDNSDKKTRKK